VVDRGVRGAAAAHVGMVGLHAACAFVIAKNRR
jgi:hypothetical protein